jgi:hypothetical protein
MNKKTLFFLITMMAIGLIGCQEVADTNNQATNTNTTKTETKPEVVDRGTPYSVGPSAPPGNDVGPSSPPPEIAVESTDQAQAVTTNENIRLTLPRKTE